MNGQRNSHLSTLLLERYFTDLRVARTRLTLFEGTNPFHVPGQVLLKHILLRFTQWCHHQQRLLLC